MGARSDIAHPFLVQEFRMTNTGGGRQCNGRQSYYTCVTTTSALLLALMSLSPVLALWNRIFGSRRPEARRFLWGLLLRG